MEFAYNNHYQTTIKITLNEVLYGKKYRLSLHWDKIGKKDAWIRH